MATSFSPPLPLHAPAAGGCRFRRGVLCTVRCSSDGSPEYQKHAAYMRRAVELARRAAGRTSPNPMVGCVIVRDGEVVGEGFHPKAGQPHAEVFALRDAGDRAENATAYVSLEPCNHYGRTPPCTEALIGAKVKQVIVGMTDPNPIVSSKGAKRLQDAGIDVVLGIEEALCRRLNEAYIHRMVTGRPFVTLRYSVSLNGRLLNESGLGADESGGYLSLLLMEHDAIILSSSIAATSAFPTSHETGAKQPLCIVISTEESTTLSLPFLTEESASRTLVVSDKAIRVESKYEGVEVVVLEQMSFISVLELCAGRGLCSMLFDLRYVERSHFRLLNEFHEEKLVQKVVTEVLPVWGGTEDTVILPFGMNTQRLGDFNAKVDNDRVLLVGYL